MASTSNVVAPSRPLLKYGLRVLVVAYLFFLVAWPTSLVVKHTFEDGLKSLVDALSEPDTLHSLKVTAIVSVTAVVINLVFGVGVSLLLVRHEFPGKRALSAMVDVPLSVSPVVVGLALILVYNPRFGWFGPTLADNGIQIVFAYPAMIMATCFVALPLVIREVVPVLEEVGTDQEQAAWTLGAKPRQAFLRVTLPAIRWARAARSAGRSGSPG